MKKIQLIACVCFCVLLFAGCKEKTVKDYYEIYVPETPTEKNPPHIIKVGPFKNDSIALARTTKRVFEHESALPTNMEREIKKVQKEGAPAYITKMKTDAIIEAYEELMAEHVFLMIFEHGEKFKTSDFIKVVKKHGMHSRKTEDFIEKNNLSVSFVEIYP